MNVGCLLCVRHHLSALCSFIFSSHLCNGWYETDLIKDLTLHIYKTYWSKSLSHLSPMKGKGKVSTLVLAGPKPLFTHYLMCPHFFPRVFWERTGV